MKSLRTGPWIFALVMALMIALGPSASTADQVFLDDVIIDGSMCVGMDCVNGEEFSFATILFKENNLRLFFNDTSSSATFPNNDWEIVVNDAANGGGNYLGFADRGAGQVSTSGEGQCVGGDNDGLVCGVFGAAGGSCKGTCNGGLFNGSPCFDGPGVCTDNGGTCVGAGVCTPPGAIVFKIEAGAGEDSLVIDSGGVVNLGPGLTVNGDVNVPGAINASNIGSGAKAGVIPVGAFSAKPIMAAVVFDTPFAGAYALVVTPITSDTKKALTANVVLKNANGFSVVLKKSKNLVAVDWMAYPVGE